MLKTNDKLVIVIGSIFASVLMGLLKASTGVKGDGIRWIKDYPAQFWCIVIVLIIYLAFMFVMYRKNNK